MINSPQQPLPLPQPPQPIPLKQQLPPTACTNSNSKRIVIKDYVLANGSVYSGEFMDGKMDGWGVLRYPNNERYEGNFVKGKKQGLGKYYYQSGEYYIGGWNNNKKEGQGIYFYDSNKRYEGQFKNNLKHGRGVIYETNGNTYKGKFAENHKHGSGEYYDAVDNKTIKFVFDKGQEVSSKEVLTQAIQSKQQSESNPVASSEQSPEISPDGITSMILQNHLNQNTPQPQAQPQQPISQSNPFISLNFSNETPSTCKDLGFKKQKPKQAKQNKMLQKLGLNSETLHKKRIDEWNEDNVCEWLDEIQFGDVAAQFRFQGVTGFTLLRLKDQDLKQLGIAYQQDRVVLLRDISFLRLFFKTQCLKDQIINCRGLELDYDLLLKLEKLEGRSLKRQQSQIIYEEQFRKNQEHQQQSNQMFTSLKKEISSAYQKNQNEEANSDQDPETLSSSSTDSSNQSKKNEQKQKSNPKNSGVRKKLHIQRKIELQMKKKRIDTKIFIESSQIQIGKSIGKGTYGQVFLAQWINQVVAVKRYIKKNGFRNRHIARFLEQAQITNKLLHPNIVLYMGMFIIDNDYALVMEYLAGGSLFDYLHIKGYKLSQSKILRICRNIAIGMVYLHGKNIIHCDLKSSNLLLDENLKVKISDFGLSQIKKPACNTKKQRSTRLGTPQWMAPQVMRGQHYEFACDVYSFGMVLWELLTCQIPYRELTQQEVIDRVTKSQHSPIPIPNHQNNCLVELFLMCTQKQPKKRPTFNQIVKQLQNCAKSGHSQQIQHKKRSW